MKKRSKTVILNIKTLNDICSDLCFKTVLLCDDVPYNLIPLEVMLQEHWQIES